MGIESGNEHMRRRVMKRPISDQQILDAFSLLQNQGIDAGAFNILGMPGETASSVLDTIRLNAKANPSRTFNAYFYPFHGTEAYKKIVEENIPIEDHDVNDFFSAPVLRLDTISTNRLIFYYRYFMLLREVDRRVLRLPPKVSGPLLTMVENILKSDFFPCTLFIRLFPGKDQVVNRLQQYKTLYRVLRGIKKRTIG